MLHLHNPVFHQKKYWSNKYQELVLTYKFYILKLENWNIQFQYVFIKTDFLFFLF